MWAEIRAHRLFTLPSRLAVAADSPLPDVHPCRGFGLGYAMTRALEIAR
jgi:hypothetical protein